jgi:hypothetical protein
MQLCRYFVTQSSEFCRHNHLCCFSTSVYCCKRIFRYRLSPETFGYTLVHDNFHSKFSFVFIRLNIPSSDSWAPSHRPHVSGSWRTRIPYALHLLATHNSIKNKPLSYMTRQVFLREQRSHLVRFKWTWKVKHHAMDTYKGRRRKAPRGLNMGIRRNLTRVTKGTPLAYFRLPLLKFY